MYVGESDGRWLASILRPASPGRDLPTLPSFQSLLACFRSPLNFNVSSIPFMYFLPTLPRFGIDMRVQPYVYPIANPLTFFYYIPRI